MSGGYRAPALLIAGEWREGRSTAESPVINPADGDVLDRLRLASHADLDEALGAAGRGFEAWRTIPAAERAHRLEQNVAALRAQADRIGRLLTLEQGKPLAEARAEVAIAADLVKWYAEEARRAYGRVIPARAPDSSMTVLKQPVGAVAAFSPWNFPLLLSARKIGGALAAGCSIVLKGAEETPASVAAMVECLARGLPAGTLQLVFGVPSQVSERLLRSEVIRKVTFTGSVAVGKEIARLASQGLKRVTLELGGHAPAIVWSDADLDRAIPLLVAQKFRNAGQACLAPSRFLVHADIFDEFAQRFTAAAAALRVGSGLDADTQMGPLANARRLAAMAPLVDDALGRGARLLTGGRGTGRGYFWQPTVLVNVPRGAQILQEEPFGPLAPLERISELEDALERANSTRYGLSGYLFTDSARVVHRVSERLQVGTLAINSIGVSVPEAPFGGVKDSGYGSESGTEGLDAFLDTKFVHHAV